MIRIGVIGYGYWGPNLVRNCFETKKALVACVSDLRDDRLALLNGRYPTVKTTRDCHELIDDPAVDAVLGQLESACCALRRRMNPAVQS